MVSARENRKRLSGLYREKPDRLSANQSTGQWETGPGKNKTIYYIHFLKFL